MSWTNLLQNAQSIEAIFGRVPSLEKAQIREIVFNEDGPTTLLRLDLSEFPEKPPEKWKRLGYNRVQLRLLCLGVKSVKHDGWGTNNTADIVLSANSLGGLRLLTEGGLPRLTVEFDVLLVDGVSGYRDEAHD